MIGVNSTYVRQELNVISTKCQEKNSFLLTEEGRTRLSALVGLVKNLSTIEVFIPWLKSEIPKCPPLEILWTLNDLRCFKVTTFFHSQPKHHRNVIDSLCNMLLSPEPCEELSQTKNIFVGIMSTFINLWNPLDENSVSAPLFEHFFDQVLRAVYCDVNLKFNYLNELMFGNVSDPQLTDFAIHNFKLFLYYKPELIQMSVACRTHTKKWTSKSIPANNLSIFNELIYMLPEATFYEELEIAIGLKNFNWKFILILISAAAAENSDLMKEKLDQWFKEAVENKDRDLMILVLLASRQCCAEKIRGFSSYPSWFSSIQLKTTATFSFFFETLTYLVPFEPTIHLKIHVSKVPSVPPNCQPILVDYLALAKTRLSDLNETDYIGLFNEYHESDAEGQEADIARVVSHFKDTKELPKALMEAFVFRRNYYEKSFLPQLLSIPQEKDQPRAEVIKKLYSLGKISDPLYNKWLTME